MLGGSRVACHRHGATEEHLPDVQREFVMCVEPFDERGHARAERVGIELAAGIAVELHVRKVRWNPVECAHRLEHRAPVAR